MGAHSLLRRERRTGSAGFLASRAGERRGDLVGDFFEAVRGFPVGPRLKAWAISS